MTKFSLSSPSYTPVAVADTTNMTNNGFMDWQGAVATTFLLTSEIYMAGQTSASGFNQMIVARNTTAAGTLVVGTNGRVACLSATSSVTAPVAGMSATTLPQRSATGYLLSLGINGFGGIVRWVAYPGEEITGYGLVAEGSHLGGDFSLSSLSGANALSAHVIMEPL